MILMCQVPGILTSFVVSTRRKNKKWSKGRAPCRTQPLDVEGAPGHEVLQALDGLSGAAQARRTAGDSLVLALGYGSVYIAPRKGRLAAAPGERNQQRKER